MQCIKQTQEILKSILKVFFYVKGKYSLKTFIKNYEASKNSKIDLGIFGVCYMHNMLTIAQFWSKLDHCSPTQSAEVWPR